MADEAPRREHLESPEVVTRPVVLAALGTLAAVVAAIWLLAGIYAWQVPGRNLPAPQTFPEPRVQAHEVEERQRIEAEQRRRLSEYRWADENKTLVQIPIERAMKIIAAKGEQAYAPVAPAPSALSSPAAGAQRAVTPDGAPGSATPDAQSPPELRP